LVIEAETLIDDDDAQKIIGLYKDDNKIKTLELIADLSRVGECVLS